MPLSTLFDKYRASYEQLEGEVEGADGPEDVYAPLDGAQQRHASRNEFRVHNNGSITVKRRGNNFYHRCVCWLEDHIFSHLSKMPATRARRQTTTNFSEDVAQALFSMGIDDQERHPVVVQIKDRARQGLPLRSNLVRAVLAEVAHLGQMEAGEIWEEEAPEGAAMAFRLDSSPPDYDELEPRPDGAPPDDEAPPDYEEWRLPETPPAYGENETRRNEDDHNPV